MECIPGTRFHIWEIRSATPVPQRRFCRSPSVETRMQPTSMWAEILSRMVSVQYAIPTEFAVHIFALE